MNMLQRILDAIAALAAGLAMHVREVGVGDRLGRQAAFLVEFRGQVTANSEALAKILAVLLPPEAATAVIQFEGADAKGDSKMMFKYGDGPITATLKPLDDKGNVAIIDGRPIWTLAEADISISADGMTITFSVPPTGALPVTWQVTASFDADLGQGVRTITAIGALTIVPREAVTATVEFAPAAPMP